MNRRTLLTTAAVAIGGFLGGCSGTGNGNGSAGTNDTAATPTGASTATDAPTTTARTMGRTTSATDTGMQRPTNTRDPETTVPSMQTAGPQTETARVPATGTTTPDATTATAAPTTTASATERTATTDTSTPIPIPDPPSTQTGVGVARVAFEDSGRVVVTGVITARTGCQKAMLASTQSNGTELVVTVGTERTAGTTAACTQVLTPVEYRFALTPDTAPESVTVVHATMKKRKTVTTVERGG